MPNQNYVDLGAESMNLYFISSLTLHDMEFLGKIPVSSKPLGKAPWPLSCLTAEDVPNGFHLMSTLCSLRCMMSSAQQKHVKVFLKHVKGCNCSDYQGSCIKKFVLTFVISISSSSPGYDTMPRCYLSFLPSDASENITSFLMLNDILAFSLCSSLFLTVSTMGNFNFERIWLRRCGEYL